ncbi:MAG: hypothetical protein R3D80_03955 [Paracoccaceae bacterium]
MKAALLAAGAEHGMRQVGARLCGGGGESGWVPSPLPAIYTGEAMKPYREWLSATSFEALASLGGSYVSDDVEDYYLTPWDLDYGRVVKFDHDFIGRAALEKIADGPHRRKMTLVWNPDDVAAIFRGLMDGGDLAPKHMEMPAAHYAAHPYDRVSLGGDMVGLSITPAYSPGERAWISLAILEPQAAAEGTARSRSPGVNPVAAVRNRRWSVTGRSRSARRSRPGRSTRHRARSTAHRYEDEA